MSDGRAPSGAERVLVTLFFWRALELEGGAGLVASVVRALAREGCAVTLLVPSIPAWSAGAARVVPFLARTPLGSALRYLRLLRSEAEQADAVLLIENNPTSHLALGAFLPTIRPTWAHISSPAVGREIFRRGLRSQLLPHWLAKNRGIAKLLARLVGFRMSHYVVSTRYQVEQLVALGCPPERTSVLPLGVDPDLFRPRPAALPRAGHLVVGYLGHFSPIKGVPILIQAFESAAAQRPGLRLRLAWSGKGADAEQVLSAISRGRSQGRIELLGRVDVADFLSHVDVVVLPFRSASIPHLPLVLLEAFAMGVPVITTRVGGLADAVDDGLSGFTFEEGDIAALSRLVLRLCDDPALRGRMREHLLTQAPGRFDSQRFCLEFLASVRRDRRAQASAA